MSIYTKILDIERMNMELKLYQKELEKILLEAINAKFPQLQANQISVDCGYSYIRHATFIREEPATVTDIKSAA